MRDAGNPETESSLKIESTDVQLVAALQKYKPDVREAISR